MRCPPHRSHTFLVATLLCASPLQLSLANTGVTSRLVYFTRFDSSGFATEGIEHPSVTDSGNVGAVVNSFINLPNEKFYAWEPSAPRLVAETGQTLPDGETIDFFRSIKLNDQGDAAFRVSAINETGTSNNFYFTSGGIVTPIALSGGPAPGTGGGVFGSGVVTLNGDWRLNNAGQVAFNGFLDRDASTQVDFDNDEGIWFYENGVTRLLIRENDPMPVADDAPLDRLWDPSLNDQGQVAFYGRLDPAARSVTNENATGIWLMSPGNLEPELVARSGDPAPGGVGQFVLSTSLGERGPSLSDTGLLAFSAGLRDGPDTTGSVWATTESGLRKIAQSGDPVPGLPGAEFGSFLDEQINDNGDVTFVAQALDGGPGFSPKGLFTTTQDGLSYIAVEGQPAPGAPGADFQQIFHPSMNNRGDVVFTALATTDPNDGDATFTGLWAYIAALDDVIPVALEGGLLPGRRLRGVSSIASIDIPHETEFRGAALSESGEILATIGFSDGVNGVTRSGLYAFTLPLIPEPSTACLLAGALFAGLRGRRF